MQTVCAQPAQGKAARKAPRPSAKKRKTAGATPAPGATDTHERDTEGAAPKRARRARGAANPKQTAAPRAPGARRTRAPRKPAGARTLGCAESPTAPSPCAYGTDGAVAADSVLSSLSACGAPSSGAAPTVAAIARLVAAMIVKLKPGAASTAGDTHAAAGPFAHIDPVVLPGRSAVPPAGSGSGSGAHAQHDPTHGPQQQASLRTPRAPATHGSKAATPPDDAPPRSRFSTLERADGWFIHPVLRWRCRNLLARCLVCSTEASASAPTSACSSALPALPLAAAVDDEDQQSGGSGIAARDAAQPARRLFSCGWIEDLEIAAFAWSDGDAVAYRDKIRQLAYNLLLNGANLSAHPADHVARMGDGVLAEGTPAHAEKLVFEARVRACRAMFADTDIYKPDRDATDPAVGGRSHAMMARCRKCKDDRYLSYTPIQLRSADEPTTVFYVCTKCQRFWKS